MKAVCDSHSNALEGVTRCLKHGAEHYVAPPPLDIQPPRDIGEEGEVEELLALENGPADVDAIDEHVALGENSDSSSDSTSTSSSEGAKRPARPATTDRLASGTGAHARPSSRELPAELVGVPQEPMTRGASGSGLPRVGAYGEVNTARHPEPIPTIIPDDPPVVPPVPPPSDEPKRPYPGVPYRGEKVQMLRDRTVDGHDGEGFPLDESGCRVRKNSKRPPWISTEAWPSLTLKDRAAATKEWKDALRNQGFKPYSDPGPDPAAACTRFGTRRCTFSSRDNNDFAEWINPIPAMPLVHSEVPPAHREINPPHVFSMYAAVARDVVKKERMENPKAKAALQVEWDKLRRAGKCGAWDESKVRSKREVIKDVRRRGVKAHFGRIFEICAEKNYQFDPSDPARKFKGRVVHQGNDVRDEWNDAAFFQDMASNPATMQGANCRDAYSCSPGHD